jgi:hypothetical protein
VRQYSLLKMAATVLTHAGFQGRAAFWSAAGRATGARDQLAAMCAATALRAGLESDLLAEKLMENFSRSAGLTPRRMRSAWTVRLAAKCEYTERICGHSLPLVANCAARRHLSTQIGCGLTRAGGDLR